MKKFITNKITLKILGIILLAIMWQVFSCLIGETTFILPSPLLTIKEVFRMLKQAYIYKCLFQTMLRMFIGFAISIVLAFVFGVIAGNNSYLEEIFKPTISVLKSIPTASLVYTFLVVVGARNTPILIVILVSFPILYESVLGGIKATPATVLKAGKIDNASYLKLNLKIRIPLAIPYIIVGIASSFGLALKIEIMAEVITGYTRLGLGSAIMAAQRSDPTNMVPIFAYSFVAVGIVLIFDSIASATKKKYRNSL